MPRESKKVKVERGIELCRRMHELYPSVQSALDYHDAFTLTFFDSLGITSPQFLLCVPSM